MTKSNNREYIGSQQHWEDSINADYDSPDQEDNRTQEDDRIQCPETLLACESNCIQSGKCPHLKPEFKP